MGYKPAMFLGLSALLMVLMVDQAHSLRQKRFVPQQALAALDLLANDTVEGESAKFLRQGWEEESHHEDDGHDHRDLDRMVPQEARTLLDLLKVLTDGTATGESDTFLWDGDDEEEEYLFEFLGLGQDEESQNETSQEHGNNKTYEVGGKNHDEHNETDDHDHNSDEPVLVVLPSLTEDERPSQSNTSEHNVSESISHDEQNEGVDNGLDEKFSDLLGQFVTLGQRFSDLSQKFLVLGQNFLKDEGLQDGGHDDGEHYEGDGHDHTESNRRIVEEAREKRV